jgi:Spy/CpxP family protein refolding chaperone
MNKLRTMFSIACIATLGGITVASATTPPATMNPAPMRHGWHDGRGDPGGGMRRILDKLDLTAEQTAQVQAIFASAKPQLEAARESGRANREQLEVMPPTDPGYAGLVATAKSNAAEKIQLMSDLWGQVYAQLTPDQRTRIPGIVADLRANPMPRGPGRGQPPASP